MKEVISQRVHGGIVWMENCVVCCVEFSCPLVLISWLAGVDFTTDGNAELFIGKSLDLYS